MSALTKLRDFYSDEWKISARGGMYQARWSNTMEKLVDDAVAAFGDFEECVEIDTDKLVEIAKGEKATVLMKWEKDLSMYDYEIVGIKNEELMEYLNERINYWAEMAIGFIEVA